MDIHTRITAALHIVLGVLGASMMLIFALGANWLRSFINGAGGDVAVTNFVFGFGAALAVFFALLLGAEAIAGIALLKGSQTGRVFVGKRPAQAHRIEGRP